MVINYTRDAPVSDMASDYVQGKAARENLKQAGQIDTFLKETKHVVETTVQDMRDEIRTLSDEILSVERQRRARPVHAISRHNTHIHRILSPYADAGQEALANCGFAYAQPGASTKSVSEMPEGTTWEKGFARLACQMSEHGCRVRSTSGAATHVGLITSYDLG